MRILLSLLMSIVLLQSQVYALSGGPVYPSSVNSVGTYAGVLQSDASNSLGIFTMGLPQTGLAQGAVYIFQEGATFQGNIQGALAGDKQEKFLGVIDALRVVSISRGNNNSFSIGYDATANGQIKAEFDLSGGYNTAAGLLKGTSVITIKYTEFAPEFINDGIQSATESFVMSGFKQSSTVVLSFAKVDLGDGN